MSLKMTLQFPLILVFLLMLCQNGFSLSKRGEPIGDTYTKYIKMPGVTPKMDDDYICTGMALNTSIEEWIVMYDPLASANRAHHMLLYGCSGINQQYLQNKYWDCGHHGVCEGSRIMFAWAKNAPGTHLPPDVGFRVGKGTGISYLTLQIHYAKPLPPGVTDETGLKMTITQKQQKYKAGVYLLVGGFADIPPFTEKTHVDVNCNLGKTVDAPINIFAFRVHAHTLGSVITGYKYEDKTSTLKEIVKGNPQWPQAFYPMTSLEKVEMKDILHARCTYNSSTRARHTYIGSTSNDEMCNLYLMYYTDRKTGSESGICSWEAFTNITKNLPLSSDQPLPPNPELEAMTKGENRNKDKEINYNTVVHSNDQEEKTHSEFSAKKALEAYQPKSDVAPKKKMETQPYLKRFNMPGVTPKKHDAYMCTPTVLNKTQEEWVLKFQPLASANRAHHMLLYGCSGVPREFLQKGVWDCGHHGVCVGGRIMYAWAKNAPATHLPKDVGFKIGGSSGITHLVLQIHYANPLPDDVKDESGLQMTVTTTPQKYKAGIFLLAASFVDIPPHTEKTHADINCHALVTEPLDINIFAFRVHAHKLGTVISGYKYDTTTNMLEEIAKGNPQWPQAFYPMEHVVTVKPRDVLHARCTFNSSRSNKHTYIGATSDDEMCNLYLMYYTDAVKGSESGGCGGGEDYPDLTAALPPSSDQPLPPNPLLEEMTHGENKNKDKEVSYNSLFKSTKPIELEKKTQSRKDPQQPNLNDYDYPSYEGYDYRQPALAPSTRDWGGSNLPQDYYSIGGRLRAPFKPEGKYQLNPKPVPVYDEYGEDGGRMQYYATESGKKQKPMEHSPETLVSSPREGKKLDLDTSFHLMEEWGPKKYKLGQVTAVAVDTRGDVVIFHRGHRVWDGSSFRGNTLADQTNPIAQGTLLHLQRADGSIMHEWGANFFFMPHGLTMDKEDNLWLTDVGMHQVFKFPPGYGQGEPLLVLGKKFEPGSDEEHFCKPTGVAVLTNGEFFVSDGYCNSRIIHYSPAGKIIKQFGTSSWGIPGIAFNSQSAAAEGSLNIPHALSLAEDQHEVCVADRENGRVQCFKIDTGKYQRQFKFSEWGGRIFSLVYTPHLGGKLFVVNGPQFTNNQKVEIFEVNFTDGKLVTSFSPFNQGLSNPHDIAISEDGTELYVVEIGPNKIWKFLSDSAAKNRSVTSVKEGRVEVEMGQLQEAAHNTLSLFNGGYSSLGVSSVVLGLVAVPIIVLSTLAIIMKCRKKGSRNRYMDNNKFMSGINGKHKNGGLNLGSLLNKHHGFEKVSTNDIDEDDLDSADSDVEEFSLAATKV